VWFDEFESEFVCAPSDARIENAQLMVVVRILEGVAFGRQLEPSRLDFGFCCCRLDSMKGLGVLSPTTGRGGVIDDQENSAGLQSGRNGLVEARNVRGPESVIV
jgi:hypothetical protein